MGKLVMIVNVFAYLMMGIAWKSVTSQVAPPPTTTIPPPTTTLPPPSPPTTTLAPPPPEEEEQAEDPIQEKWTWCVESQSEYEFCNRMVPILSNLDDEKDEHIHSCLFPEGHDACMKKISNGEAKFAVFDGGEIWEAYKEFGLKPIRIEIDTDNSQERYYGVGVVNGDKCPGNLKDLKGMKSCHTGYGRASGWTLPVAFLIMNNIMPIVSSDPLKTNDIESVEAFFSKSCAPNEDSNEICTACKTVANCNEDDPYYDYVGAFRCLVEGSGDVAFTKGTIPSLYSKGGVDMQNDWINLKDATQYKLVCPSTVNPAGALTCDSVNNYRTCNFGSAPGHTIMTWGNFSQHEIDEFNAMMDKAISDLAFIKLFANTTKSEFLNGVERSVQYNGTVEDLLGSLYNSISKIESVNAIPVIASFASPHNYGVYLPLLILFTLIETFLFVL